VLDVSAVVSEALRLLQTTVAARATLEQIHRSESPRIRGDRTQLRQVVVNLVMNALDALGGRRGTIVVSTEVKSLSAHDLQASNRASAPPPGQYAVLTVRDDGEGMSQPTLSRIFEPFFSTKGAGRGMGLAATLGIVRAHGGELSVTSTPGQGSCFAVMLPAEHEPVSTRGRPGVESVPVRGHGKVLVIDDERAIRTTASSMLRELGYDAIAVEDAIEGSRYLKSEGEAIRLAILDLTMPTVGGRDALLALRQAGVPVPVLLTSGYHEGEVANLLREPEVMGFLQKPLQMASLERALRRALPS
jgi:CheY-like chemotaxis protein